MCSRLAALGCAVVLAGCGSPTKPDPRIPPATGSPSRLMVTRWDFDVRITSLNVEASWGDLYKATRDVTTEATWTTSDPQVVRIPRGGQLESVAPGDATVTITYRDVAISRLMRVFAGESPLLVLTTDTTTYVGAYIRDTTNPSGRGIDGVLVEILSGPNAGRTATTDGGGFYRFLPPFVCGPLTARASKAGYYTRAGASVMCENGMPELSLTAIR